jgi:aspartate oxidase
MGSTWAARAAGEAACWDMHGFNRLGGNSVAETVVAGMIMGESVADLAKAVEALKKLNQRAKRSLFGTGLPFPTRILRPTMTLPPSSQTMIIIPAHPITITF